MQLDAMSCSAPEIWGSFLQIAQNPAGRKSPNTAQRVGEGGQEPTTGTAKGQSPAPRPYHTELPKQLLCEKGEKGSAWLKNGSLKTTTGLHVGLEWTTRVTEPSA